MTTKVRIFTGPARSGKTAALLEHYRRVLGAGAIGAGLWIAPTRRLATEIRTGLVEGSGSGFFSPAVTTFDGLIQSLIAYLPDSPRYIGNLLKRQLITRILADHRDSDRIPTLGPIADTSGAVELVSSFIRDMKRQGIAPTDLAKRAASLSATTAELSRIYDEYQQLCDRHRLFDSESQSAAVVDFFRTAPIAERGPWSAVRTIIVDGFADFTRSQLDLLAIFAANADELLISLVSEPMAHRSDLFLKPRQTLAALKKRFRQVELVDFQPNAALPTPAVRELEQRIFRNPRDLEPADSAPGIEILGCAGVKAEIEAVARRIKRLLCGTAGNDPVAADKIAVVFRTLEPVDALVREVFDDHGIPFAIACKPRLRQAPLVKSLMSILRLQTQDWPFRQLLAVLSNNFLDPAWPEWRLPRGQADVGMSDLSTVLEWTVRQLQVPQGRAILLKLLRTRSTESQQSTIPHENDDADAADRRQRALRFRHAANAIEKLSSALSSLDRPKTLEEWIGTLESLMTDLGLLSVSAERTNEDYQAWRQLKAALAALAIFDTKWLDAAPAELSLSQLLSQLQTITDVERVVETGDESGKVRVLDAQGVRGMSATHLFVAGLSEQSFPTPSPSHGYGSDDFRALRSAGYNAVDQDERSAEEMLLFYEVVSRATKELVLSYPALDATAQPLLPSPYVIELERCFRADSLRPPQTIVLSPIRPEDEIYSASQSRIKSVADLLEQKPERFASLVSDASVELPVANLVAGLNAIVARGGHEFGAFEGVLSSDQAKAALGKRFDPSHCWSVSRLERYASCPFQFYLSSVLRIKELPDLNLSTDYRQRGALVHDALAELHRKLMENGQSGRPSECDSFNQLSDDTLAVVFENIRPGSQLEKALRTIDLRLITQWMQQYANQHQQYDRPAKEPENTLRPAHFEVSFGLKRGRKDQIDPLSTEEPFTLVGEKESINLAGRIDRIDVGLVDGQVVFNIIDYKSGMKKRITNVEIEAGLALQLPLYAMAVQELLMIDRRAVPWRVGYWYLKEKGFESHSLPQLFEIGKAGPQETELWKELRGTLLARVFALVRGIRSGEFPVYSLDDNCTGICEYRTVCRIGHVRALGKQWSGTPAPKIAEQGS
jgi:ATP-dependent helicase/nuclease subunit B